MVSEKQSHPKFCRKVELGFGILDLEQMFHVLVGCTHLISFTFSGKMWISGPVELLS